MYVVAEWRQMDSDYGSLTVIDSGTFIVFFVFIFY